MISSHRVPDRRTRRALDVFLLLWIVAWIVLGIVVGREVRGLDDLSQTTVKAGQAIEAAGGALAALDNVPVVGSNVGEVAEQAQAAGRSAVVSGRSSRDSIHDLSILLAIAIALVPSVPYLLVYLPLRLSWTREVRAVGRALGEGQADPAISEFLARRAVQNLPYDRLLEVTETPWRDLEEGRHSRLAEAELRRLGLHRRHGRSLRPERA